MTTEVLAPEAMRSDDPRSVRWLLGGVLAVVALYAATVLLPYVANGLHRIPLAELTSGRHDPKDYALTTGGLGLLASAVLLLAGLVGGTWAAAQGVRAHRAAQRHTSRLAVLTLVVCAAVLAFAASPLGTALVAWQVD